MRGLETNNKTLASYKNVHHHMCGLEKLTPLFVVDWIVHHHMRGLEI